MSKLETLIPEYAENKQALDELKKVCETENAKIKELMFSDNLTEAEAGGYTVKRIIQKRETMNESKLIELLEHSTYTNPDTGIRNVLISTGLGIVKLKPYVDMDALEDAIYKGLIPNDVLLEMDSCREVKEVVTLKVSKVKEKNKNVE